MLMLLLVGQIVSAYPPLAPADAARILADSPGLSNRTHVETPADGPHFFVLQSSPTAGPYGEFQPFAPTAPLGGWYGSSPFYGGWSPYGASYGTRALGLSRQRTMHATGMSGRSAGAPRAAGHSGRR